MKNNSMQVHQSNAEPWTVTLVDTGEKTLTGGRLKRVLNYVKDEDAFCFTYGDGVSDVNIKELIAFHQKNGKLATLTATRPAGRYGALIIGPNDSVDQFKEKPEGDGSWVNGGFFVLHPSVIDRIDGDQTSWGKRAISRSCSRRSVGRLQAHRILAANGYIA
jgi:glucose-1-phosphate cytidylyltransferase